MALLLPDCTSKRKSTTGDRDRMTRIGFAYNQKPETSIEFEGQLAVPASSASGSSEEEPPSFSRALGARNGNGNGHGTAVASTALASLLRAPSAPRADDAFAEWDA